MPTKKPKAPVHDCLKQVIATIKKDNALVESVRFACANIVSFPPIKNEDKKTGQPIEIGLRHKKRDGTITTKYEKTFITHGYCPFCGKKYK